MRTATGRHGRDEDRTQHLSRAGLAATPHVRCLLPPDSISFHDARRCVASSADVAGDVLSRVGAYIGIPGVGLNNSDETEQ